MKKTVNSKTYGKLTYEESFWTGKRTLFQNGKEVEKMGRNTFILENNETATIKGTFISGAKLVTETKSVKLLEGPRWYEVVLYCLWFIFLIIWGSVPQLCAIIPIIGGGLGGFINAFLCLTGLAGAKGRSTGAKLAICFGTFIGAFVIDFILACIILAILL